MHRHSSELRQLLLLHSLEDSDALGKVIPLDLRERASREALPEPDFLTARSSRLLAQCHTRVSRLVHWGVYPPWRWMGRLGGLVVLGALLVGWFTNELGPNRLINILAFPLLGLIIWNICVCGYMLMVEFRNKRSTRIPSFFPAEDRLRQQMEKRLLSDEPDPARREFLSRGMMNFFRKWHGKSAPATAAKTKLMFHLAALALAAGIVGGMYFQALRKEYRAAWESTFLDANSLNRCLKVVLGPASALTNIPVPGSEELTSLRLVDGSTAPSPHGNAAQFIHLWAGTAGLFIGLPRLILIGLALRQKVRFRPDWSEELALIESRAKDAAAGRAVLVDVSPAFFTPESTVSEAVRSCALQVWGGRTQVHFLDMIPLGEESEALEKWNPASHGTLLLFSFATTPESEVHGDLIRSVASRSKKLIVITDALSFEQRHQGLPEFDQRLTQRLTAWEQVIGPDITWLNLNSDLVKNPLSAMERLRRVLS